jgi:hypothetical protein
MKPKTAWAILTLALLAAPPAAWPAAAPDQNHGLAGTAPYDRGIYTAYCPSPHHVNGHASLPPPHLPSPEPPSEPPPMALAASTSEAGWPKKECLKMDKGPAGRKHTIVGLNGVHNWLLGGYGDDTIIGGNRGDVIWADYHPSGQPSSQTATIRAGNGRNVIYANDTHNYVWTGTNSFTVVHAHVSGIDGVIHCQSRYIVVYLSVVSQRRFKLDGCHRISHFSVGH